MFILLQFLLASVVLLTTAVSGQAQTVAVRADGCVVGRPCALGVPLPPPPNRGAYAVDGDGCVIGRPCPYRRADRLLVIEQVPADPRTGSPARGIGYTVGNSPGQRPNASPAVRPGATITSLPRMTQPAWGAPLWTTASMDGGFTASAPAPEPAPAARAETAAVAAAPDPRDVFMATILRGMQPGVLAAAATEAARQRAIVAARGGHH